uniref:Transmembrane protein n=1 Tax=Tanacetum cinerariifolium TaxID=118510 RepID=A0A699K682_TANCI|nr:hypothetical protein [Tanacetum cinerariifolium]
MKGNEKNNETLIVLTPILSVEDLCCDIPMNICFKVILVVVVVAIVGVVIVVTIIGVIIGVVVMVMIIWNCALLPDPLISGLC